MVNKLASTIAVVTVRTLGDKLTKVQTEAMIGDEKIKRLDN